MSARPVIAWTLTLLSATAAAQVQVTASGTLRVSLQPSSGPIVTYTQPVAGPTSLSISSVGSAALTTGTVSELTVTAQSPPYTCYGCWSLASGDVLLKFSATVPTAGVLRLETAPRCLMTPPFFDVDNDGSFELVGTQASQTAYVPVVLGLDPLPVRVFAETVNFGASGCSFVTRVSFVSRPKNLTTVNTPCGPTLGASLTGPQSARKLIVRVGAMNGQIGALFVGGHPTPHPTTCAPATTPAAAVILVPGPNGAELPIPISNSLLGTFTLQYVELLPNNRIVFSNGVVAIRVVRDRSLNALHAHVDVAVAVDVA